MVHMRKLLILDVGGIHRIKIPTDPNRFKL